MRRRDRLRTRPGPPAARPGSGPGGHCRSRRPSGRRLGAGRRGSTSLAWPGRYPTRWDIGGPDDPTATADGGSDRLLRPGPELLVERAAAQHIRPPRRFAVDAPRSGFRTPGTTLAGGRYPLDMVRGPNVARRQCNCSSQRLAVRLRIVLEAAESVAGHVPKVPPNGRKGHRQPLRAGRSLRA